MFYFFFINCAITALTFYKMSTGVNPFFLLNSPVDRFLL